MVVCKCACVCVSLCVCVCVQISMSHTSSGDAGSVVSPVQSARPISMMLPSPTFSPSPTDRPRTRDRPGPHPEPHARKSLPFTDLPASRRRDEAAVHAPTRTFSWPRSSGTNRGARVEDLCGDGYEFVVTRLSRGVRVHVTKDGEVIVPEKFGLSLSHPPGADEVQIDKFNIMFQHRRRRHGTEIMRRLAKWYLAAGTSSFTVTAWTEPGRKFYKKCGFERNVMGDVVLQLRNADWNSTRRMATNATRVIDRGNLTSESEDNESGSPVDCAINVQGSVRFKECDEQVGNSCGPHAVRNALLALGNDHADRIDLSKFDVAAEWIDAQLLAASSAMHDPFGLVDSHVLHIDMLSQLKPLDSDPDLWQHAIDPLCSMMSDIFFKKRHVPNKILVLAPTQERWDWKSLSHFICIEISWEISENDHRLDIAVLDSSKNQRRQHGKRVMQTVDHLRDLLVPTVQSLHKQRNLDSQSTTAGCEEAPSPSHVENGGGSTKVPAADSGSGHGRAGRGRGRTSRGGGGGANGKGNYAPMSMAMSDSSDPASDDTKSVESDAPTVMLHDLESRPSSPAARSVLDDLDFEMDDSWLRRAATDGTSTSDSELTDLDSSSVVTGGRTRRANFQKNATIDVDWVPPESYAQTSLIDDLSGSDDDIPDLTDEFSDSEVSDDFFDLTASASTARARPTPARARRKSPPSCHPSDASDSDIINLPSSASHLVRDFDRLSRSNSKRMKKGSKGAVHASGYRRTNQRLDQRRKGKPSISKGVKELQEHFPSWTIDEVGEHSTYLKIQEKGQPVTCAISMNRAPKALQVLEYRDCVKVLLPDSCKCSRRCYEKVKATDVLTLRRENFELNPDEKSVSQWLVTRLRAAGTAEDGFPFSVFGHEVCGSFYAKAHGVGRNKALGARQFAIQGVRPARRRKRGHLSSKAASTDCEFEAVASGKVPKSAICAAFWEDFINIFSQKPNTHTRLYPVTHTDTCTRTRTRTRAYTRTHAHARAHARSHTRTRMVHTGRYEEGGYIRGVFRAVVQEKRSRRSVHLEAEGQLQYLQGSVQEQSKI